jgi:phage-related protein
MANKATISIGLELTSLKKTLADALAQINKLGNANPSVKVDVNDSEVESADKKIDSLSRTETVKVDVDTKGAEASAGGFSKKLGGLGAIAGGALGGAASQALSGIVGGLKEGALAADEFQDSLEVAFKAQGIADVDAEIEKVSKSSLELANNLGQPVARTRELAVSVASLGGFTGESAQDLTKLAAGLETFTNGAVKGEAVAKAFARGINDPEGAAAIENLSKKYPQLAEVLKSNISPAEKLKAANEQLGESFKTVADQQSDVGGILNKLQNQLGEVFEKIGSQLLEALIPLAQTLLPVLESLLPVLQGILTPLAPILQQIGGAISTLVSSLSGPLLNLVSAILEPLLGLIQQLVPVILQVVNTAMVPFTQIINILADTFRQLFPALQPIFDVIIQLLPTIAQLYAQIGTALVPVIGALAKVFITLVKLITENKVVMGALNLVLSAAIGIIQGVANVLQFFASVATSVITVIDNVVKYITRLINAIASFDLTTIKNALLGIDDTSAKTTQSLQKQTQETNNVAAATDNLAQSNKNAGKTTPVDPEKAKAAAEALRKAKEELAGLTAEQAKARELAATDSIASDEERAKKRIEIEQKYAIAAIEEQRKQLKSTGELRTAEEEVINKRIEILREDNGRKIAEIEAKARAQQLKAEEEQQKKLDDITAKFAAQRVERLKAQLAAGNAGVANELLSAQRAVIEGSLSEGIDAIIEQTPAYKEAIDKLAQQLQLGLIDPSAFKANAAEARQRIFQELQSLPSDTSDVYALQIRAAYTSAGDEIAKGTAEIVAQIRQQQVKQAGDIFADSLRGIGEALRSVDFATIYGDAATQAASLNEEQDKLIQSLKDGTTTYQDAVGELQNLSSQQEQTASATAQAIAASFQAIADQQAKAAEDGINQRNQNLARINEIADEEIQLAKDKAAALKAIEDQAFADEQARQAARDSISTEFAQKEKNLTNERDQLAKQSQETQAAALENLAVSAGAAFASLVAGGESAGEALKKVVGQTVAALLDLYTPSIVALFSSVIPPPFGQIAGLAAVQGLKALLQSALNGFEEGGYTGSAGTSQVAGVVHGQEFVMTAETTRKNRALLEHLHSGKSVESFPALQKMLAENQISTIPVTELQLMRSELSAIRQRLDSMPNGIQGNMGVDVQVGMDTYLYERDRSRMIARKLRG